MQSVKNVVYFSISRRPDEELLTDFTVDIISQVVDRKDYLAHPGRRDYHAM
jgi:hypothetical protein